MSNPTTIDQAADEFVDQYGHAAVDVLRTRAKAAAERKLQEAADPSD